MKVVILAGGYGSRLGEETSVRPKPMVKIGNNPILWHIIKYYSSYGYNDFIILLGYKGYMIKEYFYHYSLHKNNVTIDMATNTVTSHSNASEPWTITLVETGRDSMTGGRIKQAEKYIDNNPFMLTYGDGLSDVNLDNLVSFHKNNKKIMTMTTIKPAGKYGVVDISGDIINKFVEKPKDDTSWINGGFFVCEPDVMNYISNNNSDIFEEGPLQKLAKERQLAAYKHNGYWGCMDTLKDKNIMNEIWDSGKAPWKIY